MEPPAPSPPVEEERFEFGFERGSPASAEEAPPIAVPPVPATPEAPDQGIGGFTGSTIHTTPAPEEETSRSPMPVPTPPASWDEEEGEETDEDRPGFWGRLFRRGRKQEEEIPEDDSSGMLEPEAPPEETTWEAPAPVAPAPTRFESEPQYPGEKSAEGPGSPALAGNWEEDTMPAPAAAEPAAPSFAEELRTPSASITVDVPSGEIEEDAEEDVQRIEVPVVLRADQLRAGARLQLVLEIRIVAGSTSGTNSESRVA